jgi:peptidoglycan-associated lipoprotein
MTKFRSNRVPLLVVAAVVALVAGCHKQVAQKPAPAPAPQPQPTVAASAPATPRTNASTTPAPAPSPSLEQLFQMNVKDAYFDYDKSALTATDRAALTADAEFLNAHPSVRFTIEGHCDERGSEEYNLGLGDRRATSAKAYLVDLGISNTRIQTTSYGKERPFCTQETESCWSQNRRAHFTLAD